MSKVKWGNDLSYLVYKRTYAREVKRGVREEFNQTVDRVLKACRTQLKLNFTAEEENELRSFFHQMKCSVAGRFLWQLGTPTVDRLGLLSLQNCATIAVDDPVYPFTWAMDALMLGCGVGFNLQREYVYELPKVRRAKLVRKDTKDADFIIPDSREGWVKLLEKTLEAHFITGKGFSFSTVCIRGAGTPINGFGGVASGPEVLCEGIERISEALNRRAGKKMRPIDCLDVMNIIGSIVVAGNVRRSAQIAIGDFDDLQFLQAKNWQKGNIPNHRAMSNNTIVCNDIDLLSNDYWDTFDGALRGEGEVYGLFNMKLARSCGRIGDEGRADTQVIGLNPCGEQTLASGETCCLAETFLPNITDLPELLRVLKYMYLICKHSLRLKCHHLGTQSIVHANMRMGIGVTGYLQASEIQREWLKHGYNYLRTLDQGYSMTMGWPESVKLTTVKPSGTLSLLAGVTPGVHPGFARYFIRRVRIASNSPLLEECRGAGYPVEYVKNFDGSLDHSTQVVSFPCSFPEGTVFAADISAVEQMEYVKRLQHEWSDNAVSCTIYYKEEEIGEIKSWLLKNYNDNVKSISFLPHSEHGFEQAPYEEISKEEWEKMSSSISPIQPISFKEEEIEVNEECESGMCPIR